MSIGYPASHYTLTAGSGGVTINRFALANGTLAGVGSHPVGIAAATAASGATFTLAALGCALMEAGGAIAVGGAIEVDASGRGIAPAGNSTNPVVARALTAATNQGDLILVNLIPN
ncbi:MAG: DUF2190 family protein [Magnetococcales bacterium]|nr:DUF2190 family protein [Magnetococcales bacterium]